ncbi:CbiX/SirB N-terminal domain-containing protein [Rhodoferax saidenbachensis]|uniref:Sirohydrochlorin cobaltochelatase n=1 Tax=Rhodoferax saidenbachensis TaxID=1484693 RepID=A0ABU1ZJV8_9BURK|nr:CbiX/SirB N-terminal domain-containing protein [Rhodoferax saidenbachensis]MDR7305155.1 sirohydrochlorin cobaltochelatase [Rhodoferax saidenbachensis]
MTTPQPTGIVLFAHGSRDPLWHRPIEAVAAQMRELAPSTLVVCAYLELSTPDLPAAVADLVAQGARAVRIVPMFLGVGRHAREDLPALVHDLRVQYHHIPILLQDAVGENPRMVELLAHIALDSA